ncbi:uncharacterized protein LOC132271537 isoform X2 [Cornus florida]|uniref:uncharacterized protein LOC132271537 isoform X2 n=1 Tax=Cornus florida TaxID=4283 RepID=UPI00289FB3A0|nr:uncharacterized protein LOC132271537 isoform X2 [Cornus florida]
MGDSLSMKRSPDGKADTLQNSNLFNEDEFANDEEDLKSIVRRFYQGLGFNLLEDADGFTTLEEAWKIIAQRYRLLENADEFTTLEEAWKIVAQRFENADTRKKGEGSKQCRWTKKMERMKFLRMR